MKTLPRLTATLILACTLGACASEAEQTPPVTTTQAAAEASVSVTAAPTLDFDNSTLKRVDAVQFSRDGRAGFSYTNEGKQAFCAVNADAIVCGGTADDSVPDVTFTSNSAIRPNAIGLGEAGLAYTLTEGLPQLNIELRAGQWVDFGIVECAKPNTRALICRTSSAAFTIDGSELDIHTQGAVLDEFAQLAQVQMTEIITPRSSVENQATSAHDEVTGPFTCDVVPGFRPVRVDQGTISCHEAMNIIAHYDSIAVAQGTGNTLSVEFDGWLCYSPTAVNSQLKGIATGCRNDIRGINISVPLS